MPTMDEIKEWCEHLPPAPPDFSDKFHIDARDIMERARNASLGRQVVYFHDETVRAIKKSYPWYLRPFGRFTVTYGNVDRVFRFNEELREVIRCLLDKEYAVRISLVDDGYSSPLCFIERRGG